MYPAEVEEVLLEHPAVDDAAVVGVAHPHTGEAVKAFVVPAAGHSPRGGRRHRLLRRSPPRPLQVPQKVTLVDEIPTGLAGKVLRRALR